MGRDQKIINRFPAFMRTDHSGKVLGEISSVLGHHLDERERRMTDILRACRVRQARHEADLHRLAALMGLSPADFIILRTFYLSQVFGPRDQYLDALRSLILRTVKLFSQGCGTIWALLEGCAVLLAATPLTREDGTPALEHPDQGTQVDGVDRGGFIHRLAVTYKTMEAGQLKDKNGYIYLVENPLMEKSSQMKQRRQKERFPITKRGFFDARPAVKITGIQRRTVFPQVINITTGQGIGFNGIVEKGQTLMFTREGKVYLEGVPVTHRCYGFFGALFDEKAVNTADNHFVIVEPAHALHRKFPRPVVTPVETIHMPDLPLGDSTWRFSVREGAFDADTFDRCVFALPQDPAQLNALTPSGGVEVLWDEHEPWAATLLIPDNLKALDDFLDSVNLTSWIRAGLDRFRGAGIRINVDYYSDDWIVSHSILRNADALIGRGIFFDGTVL